MRNREPRMTNESGSSFSVLGSSFPGFLKDSKTDGVYDVASRLQLAGKIAP